MAPNEVVSNQSVVVFCLTDALANHVKFFIVTLNASRHLLQLLLSECALAHKQGFLPLPYCSFILQLALCGSWGPPTTAATLPQLEVLTDTDAVEYIVKLLHVAIVLLSAEQLGRFFFLVGFVQLLAVVVMPIDPSPQLREVVELVQIAYVVPHFPQVFDLSLPKAFLPSLLQVQLNVNRSGEMLQCPPNLLILSLPSSLVDEVHGSRVTNQSC